MVLLSKLATKYYVGSAHGWIHALLSQVNQSFDRGQAGRRTEMAMVGRFGWLTTYS